MGTRGRCERSPCVSGGVALRDRLIAVCCIKAVPAPLIGHPATASKTPARHARARREPKPMPSLRFTRRLPATAILGVGLALGTAQPAVADPVPMAKVTARGEREMSADQAPATRELLLLVVAMGGLAIGAGGVIVIGRARHR